MRVTGFLVGLAVLALASRASAHEADSAGVDAPPGDEADEDLSAAPLGGPAPATRYAALDQASCEAELGRRRIAFARVDSARGVVAPVRLGGPLSGVTFRSMLPASQRKTSVYEIYDCRLVLALDDFAKILAAHDVTEVIHYSVYRPPAAKQILSGPGRRHTGGLAIDAAVFKLSDGTKLDVEKDFHGRIGGKPCPITSTSLPAGAVQLRSMVCEAANARLFNVMLTPDYNWQHRNHFHLEVTAGSSWTFVR